MKGLKIHVGYDAQKGKRAIGEIVAKVKAASVKAMLSATREFRSDARHKVPRCPVRSGHMYSMHKVSAWKSGDNTIGKLHVDTPYAASVHEGVVGKKRAKIHDWTKPGSGPHWVLAKAIRYKQKYIDIARGVLFRRTRGHHG